MNCSRCDGYYDESDSDIPDLYSKKYINNDKLYCYHCYDNIILKKHSYVQCTLCSDHKKNDINFINKYEDYYICISCYEIQFNNIIIIKKNEECTVCYEYKKLFKLPSCDHYFCIECIANIYYGKHMINYRTDLRKFAPIFPYDEFIKEKEYEEWADDWTREKDYDYDKYFKNISYQKKIQSKRPLWMNSKEFIEYEKKSYIYEKMTEKDDDLESDLRLKLHNEKFYDTSLCPLCRK